MPQDIRLSSRTFRRGALAMATAAALITAAGSAQGATAGVITEFRLRNLSEPHGITAGPYGSVWFTETGLGKLGSINHAGRYSDDVLLSGGSSVIDSEADFETEPAGITLGPDRNLWVAESGDNRIARVTPWGESKEFSSGITNGAQPSQIVVGADGNLWFTEPPLNQIGMITTGGKVTEFPLSVGAAPAGITAGPSGSPGTIWFTEPGSNGIGVITTDSSHTLTEYTNTTAPGLPTSAAPEQITLGPDGNLWFTDQGNSAIGTFVPGSTPAATEYAVLAANALPEGIVGGPDGNLWFTEPGTGNIGRISTAGTLLNEFPVPTKRSRPFNITVGPDRNLWFVETGSSQVGRITSGA